MKTILILLFCIPLHTVSMKGQTVLDSVKNEYSIDKEGYKIFCDLGKCYTLDLLLKTQQHEVNAKNNLFNNHFNTLYDLVYAFPRMFYKEKVLFIINDYYRKEIDDFIENIQKSDEYFKLNYHSPFFIASMLFEDSKSTRELYNRLVFDSSAYNGNYLDEYLNKEFTNAIPNYKQP